MTKLIRLLYYSVIFLVPLVMSPDTSEMFELNKIMLLYGVTAVITSLFIVESIFARRKPTIILASWLVLAFLLSQVLSLVFSVDQTISWFGWYGRFNGGVLSIIAYSVLFIVGTQVFDKHSIRTFLKVSLVASVVTMLWALPAVLFRGDTSCLIFTRSFTNGCWTDEFQPAVRMFSTLGQPNWFGAYLVAHFFIAVYFAAGVWKRVDRKGRWLQAGLIVYLLLNVFCIYYTKSRSAELALGVGLLWILYAKYKKVTIALTVIALVGAAIFIGMRYSSIVQTSNNVTDSGSIRLIVWEGALKLGLKHPLVGTGPETFGITYYQTRPVAHNATSEWDFLYNKAHNEFLNVFANTGIIGFVAYIAMLVGMWLLLRRGPRAIQAAWLTILITNFFGFSTVITQVLLYLLPLAGLTTPAWYTRKSIKRAILALLLAFPLLIIINRWYSADLIYARARDARDYIAAARLWDLPMYYDKGALAAAQATLLLAVDEKSDEKSIQAYTDIALLLHSIALSRSPQSPAYYRTGGKIYFALDDRQKTLESMRRAMQLAPTDPRIPLDLAHYYRIWDDKGNYEKYVEQAKKLKKDIVIDEF